MQLPAAVHFCQVREGWVSAVNVPACWARAAAARAEKRSARWYIADEAEGSFAMFFCYLVVWPAVDEQKRSQGGN